MSARTVYSLLEATAEELGSAPALMQPVGGGRRPSYRRYSWIEFRDAVRELAVALAGAGIGKGDVVAIASETRAELYLADFAIMARGAVSAVLYTSYDARDLVATLRACSARAVFAEDRAMRERLLEAGAGELDLQWFLLLGGDEDETVPTLERLRERGRNEIKRNPALWLSLSEQVAQEDPAILYLTSGATGEPKMALVAHRAVVANADLGPSVLGAGPNDVTIAFLPSAHILQRVVMEMLMVRCGVQIWFSESLLKLPQELASIEPTMLIAPPRLWERVYKTVTLEVKKRPQALQKLIYLALGAGSRAAELRAAGKPVPAWLRRTDKLAKALVFRRLRHRFGRRLRFAATGAAPLGTDLARFYLAIGVPLHEGFGLTEGGIVILNPLGRQKPGSIGRPLPGVEVRLASDGELLVRSPYGFIGYFRDPAATAAVLDAEGWLHTGDLCRQDEDGYLYITGRKKEVVVTSAGRKIFPQLVENLFRTEPVISQVFLVGDRLPYPAALITINPAGALSLAGMEAYRDRPLAEIAHAPAVATEVERAVARVNARLPEFDRIRRYRILEREFTIEDGELTATLKQRRMRIQENFRSIIDELYRD